MSQFSSVFALHLGTCCVLTHGGGRRNFTIWWAFQFGWLEFCCFESHLSSPGLPRSALHAPGSDVRSEIAGKGELMACP